MTQTIKAAEATLLVFSFFILSDENNNTFVRSSCFYLYSLVSGVHMFGSNLPSWILCMIFRYRS